jgi:hypothetical protein
MARFLQPRRLRLEDGCRLGGLAAVAQQLQHLEISDPLLRSLGGLAACSQLACLCLRGCQSLLPSELTALPSNLQALDVCGLSRLDAAAFFSIARSLPSLHALNASWTAAGDAAVAALTYGCRVRSWAAQAGVELPAEAATWLPLPLRHLQLAGTAVTPAGLAALADLAGLVFLDVRQTGIPKAALVPLQLRFCLQFVQGGVLTSSSALAAKYVSRDEPLCVCGVRGAFPPILSLG